MAHSTIPTVKTTVVDRLRARPALEGVQVEYSSPGDDTELESIFLDQAVADHKVNRTHGGTRKKRDELYDLDVVVQVLIRGGTGQEADARCMDLVGEIEDEFADDPEMGGTVAGLKSVTVAGVNLRPYSFDRGKAAVATVTLTVYALLA